MIWECEDGYVKRQHPSIYLEQTKRVLKMLAPGCLVSDPQTLVISVAFLNLSGASVFSPVKQGALDYPRRKIIVAVKSVTTSKVLRTLAYSKCSINGNSYAVGCYYHWTIITTRVRFQGTRWQPRIFLNSRDRK